MKKKLTIAITLIVFVLASAYIGYKIYQKLLFAKSEHETFIFSTLSLIAEQSNSFNIKKPLKVVCLGNSITKASVGPEVDWYSDWGMAATKEENDFCHVLQSKLRQYNEESSIIPLNIAQFEQNPTCDLDSLLGNICKNADIIVIRIGDNVRNTDAFKNNIDRLINKCKSHTPHILISGCFWMMGDVEKVLVNAASDNKLRFIPISWIAKIKDVYPKKGDLFYDVDGKPYRVFKEFILTHPNDEGMRMIANSIFNAITQLELSN